MENKILELTGFTQVTHNCDIDGFYTFVSR